MVRTTTSRGSSVPPRQRPSRARGPQLIQGSVRMRIGLAGVGRIGAFHAETLRSLQRRRRARRQRSRRRRCPRPLGAARRRLRSLAGRDAGRGCRRLRHRHGHSGPRTAAAARHRGRRADLLREAGGRHARGDDGARQDRRPDEHARARRLPAPLRPRLPARPAGRRRRRARLPAQHPCADPRPGPAARCLHPDERRPLPRLLDPRLRHHPLRHRPRGGLGLCDRSQQGRRLLQRGRRRRHGGRGPHPR